MKALALAALFVAAGCARHAGSDEYDRKVRRWRGAKAPAIVTEMGPPTRTYEIGDGVRVMEYIFIAGARGGWVLQTRYTGMPTNNPFWPRYGCSVSLRVGADDIVQTAHAKGDCDL